MEAKAPGTITLASASHPKNAPAPSIVTLPGMMALVRALHPEKASIPIDATPTGITTLCKSAWPWKALAPIDFTDLPSIIDGITTLAAVPEYRVMLTSLPETVYSYGPKTAAVSSAAPHSRTARTDKSADKTRAVPVLVHPLKREPNGGVEGCRTCNRNGGLKADAGRESVQKSIDMRRVGCGKPTRAHSKNRARRSLVFVKIALQPAQGNHSRPGRLPQPALRLIFRNLKLLCPSSLHPLGGPPRRGRRQGHPQGTQGA